MLPNFERADWIGEFWASPARRTFGELLTYEANPKPGRTSHHNVGIPAWDGTQTR
jgi:hypothetical protein